MTLAAIHCEPRIEWQLSFAHKMQRGLSVLGIRSTITNERQRIDCDFPILLGTSCWRQIEAAPYLLVDRCSFGDTNKYVSLVWNGHGRRGDHKVPENYSYSRWTKHQVPLHPIQSGSRVVLCGQCETYSPKWLSMAAWYERWQDATHFRPHPADPAGPNLPIATDWENVGRCITLNSSVAIDALINGVPEVIVEDAGGMAFQWAARFDDRLGFMRWLAWTQFSHQEIENGRDIEHLFHSI